MYPPRILEKRQILPRNNLSTRRWPGNIKLANNHFQHLQQKEKQHRINLGRLFARKGPKRPVPTRTCSSRLGYQRVDALPDLLPQSRHFVIREPSCSLTPESLCDIFDARAGRREPEEATRWGLERWTSWCSSYHTTRLARSIKRHIFLNKGSEGKFSSILSRREPGI